jgi:hypothetical protein
MASLGVIASPAARKLAALAVVAALGLGNPVLHFVRPTPRPGGDVAAWADEAYAGLRTTLRAGERIGVLVGSGNPNLDGALSMSAQYALAPAVVEPIYLADCLSDGGKRCRLELIDRVAVVAPPQELIGIVEQRLGLIPAGSVGGVLLLEKRAR